MLLWLNIFQTYIRTIIKQYIHIFHDTFHLHFQKNHTQCIKSPKPMVCIQVGSSICWDAQNLPVLDVVKVNGDPLPLTKNLITFWFLDVPWCSWMRGSILSILCSSAIQLSWSLVARARNVLCWTPRDTHPHRSSRYSLRWLFRTLVDWTFSVWAWILFSRLTKVLFW